MGQITTNAIVLRRVDYRENDRMLTLFSPTLGRIDALCRGCRRQKSPLMAASELFCTGEYVLYQARERTTVVSCQITDSYYPLRVDYERLSHGMYALELCSAAVQPAQENERLFLLLLKSLAYLCYDTVAAAAGDGGVSDGHDLAVGVQAAGRAVRAVRQADCFGWAGGRRSRSVFRRGSGRRALQGLRRGRPRAA